MTFTLDGALAGERDVAVAAPLGRELTPLGRMFVASREGRPAGFVVQGETRGYKAPIRLFVAMEPDFEIVDLP